MKRYLPVLAILLLVAPAWALPPSPPSAGTTQSTDCSTNITDGVPCYNTVTKATCIGNGSSCVLQANENTLPIFTSSYTAAPVPQCELAPTGSLPNVGACTSGSVTATYQGAPTLSTATRVVANNAEQIICHGGACSVTPDVSKVGSQGCVFNYPGETNAITMVNIANVYYGKTDNSGWQANANYKLVSGGAATDKLCWIVYDATHVFIASSTGTWSHTAP